MHTQNCSDSGKVCGWSDQYGYYGCLSTSQPQQPADPCNGVTFEGECQGDTVVWCENNQINSIDCGKYGYGCGWNSQGGYYDCVK